MVDDFAVRMEQQLDLRLEGRHLQRFRHNFRDVPDIHFPEPVDTRPNPTPFNSSLAATSPVAFAGNEQVLVESFIADGEPILSYIRNSKVATEATKEKLADICLRGIVKMVLIDNLLHGDLHPGNIFVCDRRKHRGTSRGA